MSKSPRSIKDFCFLGASAALSVAVLWALNTSFAGLPRIGPTLTPADGIWSIHTEAPLPAQISAPELLAPVKIFSDELEVSHLEAENGHDLFFAQGYLTARSRLWQMEMLSRVAAGRLSEVFGKRTLPYDVLMRRLQLREAAQRSVELMLREPISGGALDAFAKGVNAYIQSLPRRDLPLEYKLFDTVPELWTPLKSALIIKLMAFQLSGDTRDLQATRTLEKIGAEDFNVLFPEYPTNTAPIVPAPNNSSPASGASAMLKVFHIGEFAPFPNSDAAIGSNSWTVFGTRSMTGLPIVSNDVHLGYSLPSLWYAIQLSAPNLNAAGASLVGVPGIVLGWNDHVAWSVTNGYTDTADWLALDIKDEKSYRYGDGTRPLERKLESISIRGAQPQQLELLNSHYGPVFPKGEPVPVGGLADVPLAFRWVGSLASNELKSFILLNGAENVTACTEALRSFSSPVQNFTCADDQGNVHYLQAGLIPRRKIGLGATVLDGSDPNNEWQDFIPFEELPQVKNPAQQFIATANQQPVGREYEHFLGRFFEVPFRAKRINDILNQDHPRSAQSIADMQGDRLNLFAKEVLPIILRNLDSTNEAEAAVRGEFERWDGGYTADSPGAVIFQEFWTRFEDEVWLPRFPSKRAYLFPNRMRMLELMQSDPNGKWFDSPRTEVKEDLQSQIRKSFAQTVTTLTEKYGADVAMWRWSDYQVTRYEHMTHLPGLGRIISDAPGTRYTLFANTGDHGPGWKSVVALGPRSEHLFMYGGGQSGNPASPNYDNLFPLWTKNEFLRFHFIKAYEPHEIGDMKQTVMVQRN